MRTSAELSSRLYQWVRRDPSYVVDPRITAADMAAELTDRAMSLVRAQWKLRGVGGGKIRFAETGCRIQHRRHCSIGSGSVIEVGARLRCLSEQGIRIGRNVTIGKYANLEVSGVLRRLGVGIEIGDQSSVGDYSSIGGSGGVRIGSQVLMGPRVAIHSENHDISGSGTIQEQGVVRKGVVIGNGCWLGSGCTILDGVELGDGCVVAAGSVVTSSFPPMSVIAGVPARLLRTRADHDGIGP